MSATPPPGGQPGPPPENPSRPPHRRSAADLDQETFRKYGRFTGWLVFALILAYVGLQLPLPYRVLAIAAGLAGLVGGIVMLVQCFRKRLPGLMYVSSLAVILCCGMFAFTATSQAIFWNATVEFDECRTSALTERSLNQCYSDYEQDMLNSVPGIN